MHRIKCAMTGLVFAAAGMAGAASATTTTFSNGDEGWVGNAEIDATVGAPAPGFHSLVESFGLSWRNESNPAFIGDYTAAPDVTISLDVLTNSITYLGGEVSRGMFVWLTDIGDPDDFTDNVSLVYQLGTVSATIDGWQNLSVTIADTGASDLPAGWIGVDGDGNLALPGDRSFSDVLANIGQIEFTTYEPGMFYGFTVFDVVGDNFTLAPGAAAVPEPASWAMMILGLGAAGAALRRRRTSVAFA